MGTDEDNECPADLLALLQQYLMLLVVLGPHDVLPGFIYDF